MATEILTLNTTSLPALRQNTPQVLDFGIVRDAAGDPLDISSGFTAILRIYLASGINASTPVSKSGTFSYGADGALKLTLTSAQSNEVPTGNWTAEVIVSDDAFATYSKHQVGGFRVINP